MKLANRIGAGMAGNSDLKLIENGLVYCVLHIDHECLALV